MPAPARPLSPMRVYLGFAVLAALLELGHFLHGGAGDYWFHFCTVRLFVDQFWQGDFYPRWGFDAWGGMGSPTFLFYFPLPFWVASLVRPLFFGTELYFVYVYHATLALALLVAGITCWHWLKDIVPERMAQIFAIVYVTMPMAFEIFLIRSAFTEAWTFALLPLAFKLTRMIAQQQYRAGPWLAIVYALMMLSNIPCMIVIGVINGIYLLGVTTGPARWRAVAVMAVAAAVAGVLCAFYVLPVIAYRPYISAGDLYNKLAWPNHYLSQSGLLLRVPFFLFMQAAMAVYVGFVCLRIWRKRSEIPDSFEKREIFVFMGLFVLLLMMLFPISEPFWWMLRQLSLPAFPYRAQTVLGIVELFLVVIFIRHFTYQRRSRTWRGDLTAWVAASCLVFGMSSGVFDMEAIKRLNVFELKVATSEYIPKWFEKPKREKDDGLFAFGLGVFVPEGEARLVHARKIEGEGNFTVQRWEWDGIDIATDSATPMMLELTHFYFPVWRATLEDGQAAELAPQEKTGRMLLKVPEGKHVVTMRYTIGTPAVIGNSISAVGLLLLAGWFRRERRRDVAV